MFEQTILVAGGRTRRAWTVPACFAGQIAGVAFLAVMPLVFYEGLPQGQLAAPKLTVPVGHGPLQPTRTKLVDTGSHKTTNHPIVEPSITPTLIDRTPDPVGAAPVDPSPACIGICVVGSPGPSEPTQLTSRLPVAAVEQTAFEPVRSLPKPTPTPPPVRVNSGMQEAKLINRVMPVYPIQAVRLRISGDVRIEAIIDAGGRIRELKVLSGHPYLVQAAVNAVREWVYRPTMLSGAPVEAMTEITVKFNLR